MKKRPLFDQIKDDLTYVIKERLKIWEPNIKRQKKSKNILAYYVFDAARDAIMKKENKYW